MTAVTVPSRRSLIGAVLGSMRDRAKARGRVSKTAAVIQEHLLTFAALGAGVCDGFLHGAGWGLGALTVALLIFDFKVQG